MRIVTIGAKVVGGGLGWGSGGCVARGVMGAGRQRGGPNRGVVCGVACMSRVGASACGGGEASVGSGKR